MLSPTQKIFLNQPVCKFMLLALNSSLRNRETLGLKAVAGELKKLGLKKCDLTGCKPVYKKEGFYYNISPLVYAAYKTLWSIKQSVKYRFERARTS